MEDGELKRPKTSRIFAVIIDNDCVIEEFMSYFAMVR